MSQNKIACFRAQPCTEFSTFLNRTGETNGKKHAKHRDGASDSAKCRKNEEQRLAGQEPLQEPIAGVDHVIEETVCLFLFFLFFVLFCLLFFLSFFVIYACTASPRRGATHPDAVCCVPTLSTASGEVGHEATQEKGMLDANSGLPPLQ